MSDTCTKCVALSQKHGTTAALDAVTLLVFLVYLVQ